MDDSVAVKDMTSQIVLLVFIISLCVINSLADDLKTSNFFLRCDANKDKQLTIKEITACMKKYHDVSDLSYILNTDGSKFLLLIDANNDNIIQLEEYLHFLDRHDQSKGMDDYDDTITVKTRDGKVRQMSREEMKGKMSDSMEGVQRKDDKMFKEDKTSGKIDEIAKKNPEMGELYSAHLVNDISTRDHQQ